MFCPCIRAQSTTIFIPLLLLYEFIILVFLCGMNPMQAASLGMSARKPDSLCCPCLAWCLSTAEKDWKTKEERKSKVLLVLPSREFGKDKVTKKKPVSIPPHDKPVFQHVLPSMVNVDRTRGCLLYSRQIGWPLLCSIWHYSKKWAEPSSLSCPVSLCGKACNAAGLQRFNFWHLTFPHWKANSLLPCFWDL